MRSLLVALLLALLCSPALAETPEDVKGVKWYQEHPEERKAMLDRCNDNPGQLDSVVTRLTPKGKCT